MRELKIPETTTVTGGTINLGFPDPQGGGTNNPFFPYGGDNTGGGASDSYYYCMEAGLGHDACQVYL